MDISIVIPVYNEDGSVVQLYKEIRDTMLQLTKSYEIIFIDDGSIDKSAKALRLLSQIAKKEGVSFTSVRFRRNFGKSAALMAGFLEAKGEIIITMDGDLQDDPGEIPKLLDKLKEGYDLVSGWKFNRKDPSGKVIPSRIFNAVTSFLTGIRIHDFNCCFKAYRREAAKELNIYGELHRYIPALAFHNGFGIAEIKVNHRPRIYGKSKYRFKRLSEGLFDLITVLFITRFIKKPMHFFANCGVSSSILGLTIIFILYIRKLLFGILIGQYQYLFLLGVLLIIVGFQFFSIGLLGELMIRISLGENKRYYIKEVLSSAQ